MALKTFSKVLLPVALAILVLVSIAISIAENGIRVVVRRGADDSIYVDAYGNQTIVAGVAQQLPILVINYSSSYQQPKMFRARAVALLMLRTVLEGMVYTQRAYSESVKGSRLSYVEAEFRQGNSMLFTMVFNTSAKMLKENMSDVGSFTWVLLYNKTATPGNQLDMLKQMVMTLQHISPQEANKQLAMAGLGWLKYRSINVSWVEKEYLAGMLFNAVMEIDYMGLGYTYNIDVDMLKRYLDLMSVIETRASVNTSMDGNGLRIVVEQMYMGEDLEKLLRDIAIVNREVGSYASLSQALPQLMMAPMLSQQQQAAVSIASNFTEALQRLANITSLALLPSNSSATVVLNPSRNMLAVDVRSLRLWHVEGPSKAVAVVTAFANALKSLGISIDVETQVEPDKVYEQQMRQSLTGLLKTWASFTQPPQTTSIMIAIQTNTTQTWIMTTPMQTTTVTLTPTTVYITTTVLRTVTQTTTATLTLATTVMKTVTTTVTEYTTAIALGVVLLVIGIATGYTIKRR
jgi:dimeric dUTPase (all-alpha-NTP-PPase superfamily)